MRKRLISMLTATVIGATALTGCGSTSNTTDTAKETEAETTVETASTDAEEQNEFVGEGLNEAKVIRIAYQPTLGPDYLQSTDVKFQWITDEFAKDGIEVEWVSFVSGAPVVEAISTGDIDIGASVGDTPFINAVANDVPIEAVALTPYDPQNAAILVLNENKDEIQSVAGLKGKRVSVNIGTNLHDFILKELNAAGLTEDDVELINISSSQDHLAALENHEVDAVVTGTAVAATFLQESDGYMLDYGESKKQFVNLTVVNSDFAEKNPELVARFVKILVQTEEYTNEHRQETKEYLAENGEFGIESFGHVDRWQFKYEFTEKEVNAMKSTIEFMKNTGSLDTDVDIEGKYSNKYYEEAARLASEEN